MQRCVGGAISEQGNSIEKCRQYQRNVQPVKLKELGATEGLIGMVVTCGLCWSGVPCEDRIPAQSSGNEQRTPPTDILCQALFCGLVNLSLNLFFENFIL